MIKRVIARVKGFRATTVAVCPYSDTIELTQRRSRGIVKTRIPLAAFTELLHEVLKEVEAQRARDELANEIITEEVRLGRR